MRQLLGGRYELIAPLGRGGMGQVWEAADRQLERSVAIKLLTHEALAHRTDPQMLVHRFAREAAVTAGLQHPGVPAVHDAGSSEDGLFLVMELIDGGTVADLVAEEGPLPAPWTAAIAAQVCSVLAVAHERALVHRDIKPQNLMVARDGTVKVLDFGVAAVLDAAGLRITRTGDTVGTPAYMAPEQLRNEPATPRTDLYALGCVLYEMLAGKPVFTATSPHSLGYKHLEDNPPPLHRPDIPPPLEHLTLQLLAKDPQQRPRDAREVYERLLTFVHGAHPLAEIAPSAYPPSGMHLHAQVLVRLAATNPPHPPRLTPTYAPTPPSQPMRPMQPPPPHRGIGWKLLHSLWITPALAFGFFTWLSFLYIGIRHRHLGWLIAAGVYAILAVLSGTFIVVTTDENNVTSTPAALTWLLLFLAGALHAAGTNPARLRHRAQPPPTTR